MELIPLNRVISIISANLPGKVLKDIPISALENIHKAFIKELEGHTVLKSHFKMEQKVVFDLRGVASWPTEQARILNRMFNQGLEIRTKKCTIMCLSGTHGLGDKNTEFYDILFEDGNILYNVSGYHLEIQEDETPD